MNYYTNKSDLDYFTFSGTSSTSFNFIVTECDNLNSFENDFDLIEIQGRNGDLLIDNKRKKNKVVNIEGFVDCDGLGESVLIASDLRDWLIGEVAYKPLTFSNDLSYCKDGYDLTKYEGVVVGGVSIVEVIKGLLNVKFKFSVKDVNIYGGDPNGKIIL